MRTYRWLTLGAAVLIAALEIWFFTEASAVASVSDTPIATGSFGSRLDRPLSSGWVSGVGPAAWNAATAPDQDGIAVQELYAVDCTARARLSGVNYETVTTRLGSLTSDAVAILDSGRATERARLK